MKSSIWYERYKPQKVQDLILPDNLKARLQGYVDKKDIPNMLLASSTPGTGKSATVTAIIKEMNSEALWINASLERGIDTLRGKISNFASSSSFDDNLKTVVLDESDYLSTDVQAGLRGFLDEFSSNCRFILTCNYPGKLLGPLVNRLEVYDFDNLEKKEMIKPIFERLQYILTEEKIEFNPKDAAALISQHYPSIRAMIADLQKFSVTGKLEFSAADLNNASTFKEVLEAKNYLEMVQRVNALSTPSSMYSFLYNNIDLFEPDTIQKVVISIAKYQDMDSNVRDKHLNVAALLAEIMGALK